MYTLAVRRDFIARHFLIGGDWGKENLPNSHHFLLEVQLAAGQLDSHGYLCDIVEVDRYLTEVVEYFGERMLNELPEFAGLNPSLEVFARIIADRLRASILRDGITSMKIVLWEDKRAWASYAVQS